MELDGSLAHRTMLLSAENKCLREQLEVVKRKLNDVSDTADENKLNVASFQSEMNEIKTSYSSNYDLFKHSLDEKYQTFSYTVESKLDDQWKMYETNLDNINFWSVSVTVILSAVGLFAIITKYFNKEKAEADLLAAVEKKIQKKLEDSEYLINVIVNSFDNNNVQESLVKALVDTELSFEHSTLKDLIDARIAELEAAKEEIQTDETVDDFRDVLSNDEDK